jgi:hypothetical protein
MTATIGQITVAIRHITMKMMPAAIGKFVAIETIGIKTIQWPAIAGIAKITMIFSSFSLPPPIIVTPKQRK